MFQNLKEKLNVFKKKAVAAVEDMDDTTTSSPPVNKSNTEKITSGKSKKGKPISRPTVKRKRKFRKKPAYMKPWIDDLEERSLIEEGHGLFAQNIKRKALDNLLDELELALYESDVAISVVDEIKTHIENELIGKKIPRGIKVEDAIDKAIRNAIRNVLTAQYINFDELVKKSEKPFKIMFVGVNGTGKTTAIARIAYRLKKKGYSVVLAAADTFRAGAIEQLTIHADKLGIKIIKHKKGSDPAAIAFDAIEHAKARHKDVVLIDTAGRMQTNTNLMDEMKKIKRIAKPDFIIFVGDALAGNDAVEQAKKFNEAVDVDAIILTKIDADAKGGGALSIAHAVGKPILFIGVGQGYKDLIPFDPDWMVRHLFGETEKGDF